MACLSSDWLCFQCSATTCGHWLLDWTVQWQKAWSSTWNWPHWSFQLSQIIPKWPSLCTWPFSSFGSRFPGVESLERLVFETLSICVLAALLSQGEVGERKPSPADQVHRLNENQRLLQEDAENKDQHHEAEAVCGRGVG